MLQHDIRAWKNTDLHPKMHFFKVERSYQCLVRFAEILGVGNR